MSDTVEFDRLTALRELNILDTPASESFDRITRLASHVFDLPIAAVSLTDQDRQWFKSRVGVEHDRLERKSAPCSEVAVDRKLLVIPDLLADPVYAHSQLALSGIRFYAGAPLLTREGFGLGAMCVLGKAPRKITDTEERSLKDMAVMVMNEIEAVHAFRRIDPLTGLPNRNQLAEDFADLELAKGAQSDSRLFILIDVAAGDQLGQLGRAMGAGHVDEIIHETGQILSGLVTGLKLYCVGVGQFAFFTRAGLDETRYVSMLSERFQAIRESSSNRFVLTTGVGVAPFSSHEANGRDLVRRASIAAEQARSNDNRIEVYCAELDAKQHRRMRLINDFQLALASNQLRLLYQPRIDLQNNKIVGVEALIRWSHPSLDNVSPGEFIPLIENTDLAQPMTEWVLAKALDQASAWRSRDLNIKMAVNVSAANLQEINFAADVLRELMTRNLPTSALEIELTESAFLADAGRAKEHMQRLTRAGVTLALDDFGTGYSSLSYLQALPAQVVKIDQSFVFGMVGDDRKRMIVASTIALAHSLGYRVVAEGVETAEVADMLREIGCDEGQGYLWSRPVSAFEIQRMSRLQVFTAA
ncbi:MAG: sensor domain-containing phosphodiesterase [Caulobacteraceae bacterium]